MANDMSEILQAAEIIWDYMLMKHTVVKVISHAFIGGGGGCVGGETVNDSTSVADLEKNKGGWWLDWGGVNWPVVQWSRELKSKMSL